MPVKRRQAAFSLAELLTATTIFCLFALLTGTCLQLASRSTSAIPRKYSSYNQARITARLIDKDLRQAVISTATPLLINPDPDTISLLEPISSDSDRIFFFTGNSRSGKSDICAIGYYTVTSSTKPRELHRYFKNSDLTWQAANAKTGFLPHTLNPSQSLFSSVTTPTENETLLRHIQSFRIRALRADATAPAAWPPQEKPALIEIILNLAESEPIQEFKLRATYP